MVSETIGVLPLFNPDHELEHVPEQVLRWRKELAACDGVVFFSPEYAHDMPGLVKNALDWVVGSGELVHKQVAVINASPNHLGAEKVHQKMKYLLKVMSADVVDASCMNIAEISQKIDSNGKITDENLKNRLYRSMDYFIK